MNWEFYLSIISTFIALVSLYVSVKTVKAQNKHNVLSLMPVCQMYTANFDDCFAVEIINKGLGMMHIEKIFFKDTKSNVMHEHLIDFITDKDALSYNNLEPTTNLMSGENVYLIKGKKLKEAERKLLVELLSGIVVYIKYTDVYKKEYEFEYEIRFC